MTNVFLPPVVPQPIAPRNPTPRPPWSPATASGVVPADAAASVMLVKYPVAIDTPPTIVDDQTVLTGLFHNYLALIIEAIEGEIGITQKVYETHGSLMAFLGIQFNNRLSNWRTFNKTFGGNEAGQIYGFLKLHIRRQGSLWGSVLNSTRTVIQGAHPTNKTPAVFCHPQGEPGLTTTDLINSCGGGVRGNATWVGDTLSVNVRGHPTAGNANPSGTKTIPANVMVVYPWEGA